MTALYAILAVLLLGGLMTGVYLVGFGNGVTAEQMRRRTLDYIVQEVIEEAQAEEEKRHAITHADLVQMEQEAKNKNEV